MLAKIHLCPLSFSPKGIATSLFWEAGRKLENPKKTQRDMEKTHTHRQKPELRIKSATPKL